MLHVDKQRDEGLGFLEFVRMENQTENTLEATTSSRVSQLRDWKGESNGKQDGI